MEARRPRIQRGTGGGDALSMACLGGRGRDEHHLHLSSVIGASSMPTIAAANERALIDGAAFHLRTC